MSTDLRERFTAFRAFADAVLADLDRLSAEQRKEIARIIARIDRAGIEAAHRRLQGTE